MSHPQYTDHTHPTINIELINWADPMISCSVMSSLPPVHAATIVPIPGQNTLSKKRTSPIVLSSFGILTCHFFHGIFIQFIAILIKLNDYRIRRCLVPCEFGRIFVIEKTLTKMWCKKLCLRTYCELDLFFCFSYLSTMP